MEVARSVSGVATSRRGVEGALEIHWVGDDMEMPGGSDDVGTPRDNNAWKLKKWRFQPCRKRRARNAEQTDIDTMKAANGKALVQYRYPTEVVVKRWR
jgi:hypothetical protein